jgi:mxaJ protein
MNQLTNRWGFVAVLALVLSVVTSGGLLAQDRTLRVCADPNNLPFSNQRLEGFENKIAALIADDLNATLQYTWMPQRRGFVRRTLRAKRCDLMLGVPSEYELVLTTKPYYSSTYVFVYPKSRKYGLSSFDDPVLNTLRIGLHAIGDDGSNTPAAHALARRGIVGKIVGFTMWDVDSVENPSGKIIDALASDDIDVAIVWGPFGGYFANRQPIELEVVPVDARTDKYRPFLPFVYEMALGVRKGDTALKAELDRILDRRKGDIEKILRDYGVPLVELTTSATRAPAEAVDSR